MKSLGPGDRVRLTAPPWYRSTTPAGAIGTVADIHDGYSDDVALVVRPVALVVFDESPERDELIYVNFLTRLSPLEVLAHDAQSDDSRVD